MNNFFYLEHALHTGLDHLLSWSPEKFKQNCYLANNCAIKDNSIIIYGYPVSNNKVTELQMLMESTLTKMCIKIKKTPSGIQICSIA